MALFSLCRVLPEVSAPCLANCASVCLGLFGGEKSSSDSGLTSRSSLDGLRGLKDIGVPLFFHGVEVPLRYIEVRL